MSENQQNAFETGYTNILNRISIVMPKFIGGPSTTIGVNKIGSMDTYMKAAAPSEISFFLRSQQDRTLPTGEIEWNISSTVDRMKEQAFSVGERDQLTCFALAAVLNQKRRGAPVDVSQLEFLQLYPTLEPVKRMFDLEWENRSREAGKVMTDTVLLPETTLRRTANRLENIGMATGLGDLAIIFISTLFNNPDAANLLCGLGLIPTGIYGAGGILNLIGNWQGRITHTGHLQRQENAVLFHELTKMSKIPSR